jgi:hypothetical protein
MPKAYQFHLGIADLIGQSRKALGLGNRQGSDAVVSPSAFAPWCSGKFSTAKHVKTGWPRKHIYIYRARIIRLKFRKMEQG